MYLYDCATAGCLYRHPIAIAIAIAFTITIMLTSNVLYVLTDQYKQLTAPNHTTPNQSVNHES
jgi:hypothetical protein